VRIRRQAQRAHNSIAHILIADRFPVVRDGMRHIIDDHRKFAVIAEVEAEWKQCAKLLRRRPTSPYLPYLGHSLPLLTGIAATAEIRRRTPKTEVLCECTDGFCVEISLSTVGGALATGARSNLAGCVRLLRVNPLAR